MNQDEALRLLRMVKAISPAQAVDDYSPEAWALILRKHRYEDAELALEQLGGEREYIHVSHIVGRIKRIRRDRLDDYGTLPDPPSTLDPGDTAAYAEWLRKTTRYIADGKPDGKPVPVARLAGKPRPVPDYDALMPRIPDEEATP